MKKESIILSVLSVFAFTTNSMDLANLSGLQQLRSVRIPFDSDEVNFFRYRANFYGKDHKN